MKTSYNREKDIRIAYIGGGSRGWAWGFMADLAMDGAMEGEVRLYDIDQDAAQKNAVIGKLTAEHAEAQSHWRYTVAASLKEALTGVDFVVISILPGTFAEMMSDVHAPEKYGVYQSVGDSIGPGGFMRSLRTIPMYVEIAEAIRDYAPQAWVISYTNPMTLCIAALYDAFPQIKAFGCCHEVFGTQKLLAAMLEDMEGITDVPRQDIDITVQGINHFTWLTTASYNGMDLFPLYRSFCSKYYETGFLKGKDGNWMNDSFASSHRVKFDLFLRYGKIAAAGDRHLAEFMPPWYLRDPQTVREWGFGLTTVDWRLGDLERRLARGNRLLNGEENLPFNGSGEEGHLMLKALLGMGEMVTNVNLPNNGQIPNLPHGAIVETNALFRRNQILPVCAGEMDGNIQALVTRHVINQQNTLRAARTCDADLAFTTFMNDPLMGNVSLKDGQRLFHDMIRAQRKYLPDGWRNSNA